MKGLGLRLQIFYFFAIGISGITFFFPVWLENRGIDFRIIGIIMAMTCVSKVVFGPLSASLSDMGLDSQKILIVLGLIGVIGTIGLIPVTNNLVYIIMMLVSTGGYLSTVPIGENITINALKTGRLTLDYGQIRVVGTIAYAVFAVVTGLIFTRFSGDAVVLYMVIFCCLAIMLSAKFLSIPKIVKNEDEKKLPKVKFSALFRQKDFKLVIAIQILYYASAAMQSGLGSAYFRAIGIPTDVIGYLIVPMIFSEAVFFLMAKKKFSHTPYQNLFLLASGSAIIRWTILAYTTSPYVIGMCQLMHSVTFAALHLGTMNYIRDIIPDDLSARAQSAYDSGAAGIFYGIAMIGFGFIYPYFGGKSFLFASFFALIAFILALKLKGIKLIKGRLRQKIKVV